jgi:hypothetical protein
MEHVCMIYIEVVGREWPETTRSKKGKRKSPIDPRFSNGVLRIDPPLMGGDHGFLSYDLAASY